MREIRDTLFDDCTLEQCGEMPGWNTGREKGVEIGEKREGMKKEREGCRRGYVESRMVGERDGRKTA